VVGRGLLFGYAFIVIMRLTDLLDLVYLFFFNSVVPQSLISNYQLVPDKNRSSPGLFLPDACIEGRSLSGLWPFGQF
jgi:hypothetical protein